MTHLLDGIAAAFTDFGVHPVLGAFAIGLAVALVARAVRRPADGVATMPPAAAATSRTTVSHGAAATSRAVAAGLPPDVAEAVTEAIRGGRTIEAIKAIREATGIGLREAKELVEALARADR